MAIPRFYVTEASSSIVLLLATALALGIANSSLAAGYHFFWQTTVGGLSALQWINECLMTIFFLAVGLEIRREFTQGELSTPEKAILPIVAAIGGMIVPALIYMAFNLNSPTLSGWGVPMATDIAFAVGVLTFFGKRIPSSLKVFLLTLAIVDDLGAVLVIAIFYTREIAWDFLLLGLFQLLALLFLNLRKHKNPALYLILGIPIWFCFLKSGVHATVAGVFLAATIPASAGKWIEKRLDHWVAFGIIPLFALANAGVSFREVQNSPGIAEGIIFGLLIGKPIGIIFFSWLATQLANAKLPSRTSWRQFSGVACLGGIGFTMSLFIAGLAFGPSAEFATAQLSILKASALSAFAGTLFLIQKGRA